MYARRKIGCGACRPQMKWVCGVWKDIFLLDNLPTPLLLVHRGLLPLWGYQSLSTHPLSPSPFHLHLVPTQAWVSLFILAGQTLRSLPAGVVGMCTYLSPVGYTISLLWYVRLMRGNLLSGIQKTKGCACLPLCEECEHARGLGACSRRGLTVNTPMLL